MWLSPMNVLDRRARALLRKDFVFSQGQILGNSRVQTQERSCRVSHCIFFQNGQDTRVHAQDAPLRRVPHDNLGGVILPVRAPVVWGRVSARTATLHVPGNVLGDLVACRPESVRTGVFLDLHPDHAYLLRKQPRHGHFTREERVLILRSLVWRERVGCLLLVYSHLFFASFFTMFVWYYSWTIIQKWLCGSIATMFGTMLESPIGRAVAILGTKVQFSQASSARTWLPWPWRSESPQRHA